MKTGSLRIYVGLLVMSLALVSAFRASARPQDLNDDDRDRYISEIRTYKHQFLAKELDLTKEQSREFFSIYDEMEDKIRQVNDETRDLEKQVENKADASDTELEAVAHAVFEQKLKEGTIEMEYYDKLGKVLTARQLLKLKQSEKRFTQSLMRQHRKLTRDKKRTL